MAELAVTPRFLAALKVAWTSGLVNLFPGGFYNGDPPEGTKLARPYLVVKDINEEPVAWTNQGYYVRMSFSLHVVADTQEDAGGSLLQAAIQGILDTVPNLSDSMRVTLRQNGGVRFLEELHYWRAVCDYTVTVGQPRP